MKKAIFTFVFLLGALCSNAQSTLPSAIVLTENSINGISLPYTGQDILVDFEKAFSNYIVEKMA